MTFQQGDKVTRDRLKTGLEYKRMVPWDGKGARKPVTVSMHVGAGKQCPAFCNMIAL